MEQQIKDKAGKGYWEQTERNRSITMRPFSPDGNAIRSYGRRMWHAAFESCFLQTVPSRRKLLEIGCGGSDRLPYFGRRFGFEVYGLDYSERGCELARTLCDSEKVPAQIICSDFLNAPQEILGTFDVVVSFGVVEHFTDTAAVLGTLGKFLQPGGLILTTVPNMRGLVGTVQKFISREVYEKHVAISLKSFRRAHEMVGLEVERCDYFMFANFGVINPGQCSIWKQYLLNFLKALTGMSWALESVLGSFPPNFVTSPYLLCIARKPERAQ